MTYPTIMPALTLDFQNSQQLDPRVTFSRSSGATYINSAGQVVSAAEHEPRFDHDPETGECLGLLIEESGTNLITYSEQFDNAAWQKTGCTVTANATESPDGTTTADLIVEDNANSEHKVAFNAGYSTNPRYFSFFAKPAGRNIVVANVAGVGGATFHLTNNTAVSIQSFPCRIDILQNGWRRCSVYYSSIAPQPEIILSDDGAFPFTYQGDGTSGIYLWGAQLQELESVLTSYIPTAGSIVIRSEDIAQVNTADIYGDEFTIINKPFGVSSGSDTLHLQGHPHVERAVVYNGYLNQEQINTVTKQEDDEFWRWRVLGSSFALPGFATDGQVTVDWGDGTVEVLTQSEHTFTNGSGYHDIGFRLDSGTSFALKIKNSEHAPKVISTGPAPESMKLNPVEGFRGCTNMQAFDATVDLTSSSPSLASGWANCSSLTSFPLIDTSSATNVSRGWSSCSGLTSFPLIDTSLCFGTFTDTWITCTGLTSFPAIVCNGSDYNEAWRNCSSLTTFPANMFDSTPITVGKGHGRSWNGAWRNCALTAQSIENILVSLDTNGAQDCQVSIHQGTNAAQSSWSTAANTALSNLEAKGWTVDYNT